MGKLSAEVIDLKKLILSITILLLVFTMVLTPALVAQENQATPDGGDGFATSRTLLMFIPVAIVMVFVIRRRRRRRLKAD